MWVGPVLGEEFNCFALIGQGGYVERRGPVRIDTAYGGQTVVNQPEGGR